MTIDFIIYFIRNFIYKNLFKCGNLIYIIKKLILPFFVLGIFIISIVSATEFRGSGTHVIGVGDKIILDDITIEIKDITTLVSIKVGDKSYDVGTDKNTALTSTLSVKAIGILVNDKRATFWVQNRKTYNKDGTYKVKGGDMIVANNGYKIKINSAHSFYAG